MFQYVRDARFIWRVGFESDRENIVLVISGQVQVLSTSLIMLKIQGRELQPWNMLHTLVGKPMEICTGLRQCSRTSDSGISPSC